MRKPQRRYLREFIPAMLAYMALILLFGWLAPRTASAAWRAVLAVLPLLPTALVIRAMVRLIRAEDELERRIDLESIAIAAMLTGFGFFSLGLLLSAGVGLRFSADGVAIWVMPCLFGSYGVVKLVVARRYRDP